MNVVLAARNLKKSTVLTAESLNTYQILNAKKLFISESSLQDIENTLA
jgi:large subunit ribosomal protein L4